MSPEFNARWKHLKKLLDVFSLLLPQEIKNIPTLSKDIKFILVSWSVGRLVFIVGGILTRNNNNESLNIVSDVFLEPGGGPGGPVGGLRSLLLL